MDLPVLTQPQNLAWLALLPLLYWWSRPHRTPRRVATPHLALWLRARAKLRRRPPRPQWWKFVLLVTAFVATVLAFSGPTHGGRSGPVALAVLLDTSASMAASESWQNARERVTSELEALPPGVEVRLALCGPDLRVVGGTVAEVLASIPPRPTGAGAIDLDQLAGELAARGADTAVWTLTDGLGPTRPPATGAVTRLGDERDNIALVHVEIDDHWPLPDLSMAVTVQSFALAPRSVVLAVRGGVEGVAERAVEVAPGATERIELALERTTGGALSIYLAEQRDGLALDDAIEVVIPAPPAPDIALWVDEEGGPWLAVAAAALAAEIGGEVVRDEQAGQAGFLLVDGFAQPLDAAPQRSLTFGTRVGVEPLSPADLGGPARVVDWDRADPITSGLDFSELEVSKCLLPDSLGGGRVLIRGELEDGTEVPLLVVRERDDGASCHGAFRLADSNLPLLAAFPQLLRRCFARSYGEAAQPRLSPDNLVSAAESELRWPADAKEPPDRPLPPFRRPGSSLVAPLLLLALAAMALRVYL